jgi:hypothetical protein
MPNASPPRNRLAAHAVCMASSVRDVLRTTQFYIRDLSYADGINHAERGEPTFLSSAVASLARLADRFMTWSANTAIKVLLPSWRQLPSPFTPGMVRDVADAIARNSLVHNPLFNAYFFRAAIHITARYAEPPHLILEHRVDAARRVLAESGGSGEFLARTLVALVEAAPIARTGKSKPGLKPFEKVEPNIAVFTIACITLLIAEEGKPGAIHDEDEFFAVVGALVQPRLEAIAKLVSSRDYAGLAAQFEAIRNMY